VKDVFVMTVAQGRWVAPECKVMQNQLKMVTLI